MPTFAALGKSGWPRMGYPFSLGQRFICADKLQHALQKWVWPAGHLLSRRRERRQRGARGQPPWNPRMVLSAFFLGKPAGAPTPEHKGIQRGGPEAPGDWAGHKSIVYPPGTAVIFFFRALLHQKAPDAHIRGLSCVYGAVRRPHPCLYPCPCCPGAVSPGRRIPPVRVLPGEG